MCEFGCDTFDLHHFSDQIAVMYLGKIIELAPSDDLFAAPTHPYTQALISAIPKMPGEKAREKIELAGDIPSPANPPSGCYFHERCKYCQEKCKHDVPDLREVDGRMVACHFADEMRLRGFEYEEK